MSEEEISNTSGSDEPEERQSPQVAKATKAAGKKKAARRRGTKKTDDGVPRPKRSLSAYMYFAKDIRQKVKAEQPELSFGELTKTIAARWGVATPEEKQPYEALAAEDRARYQAEKAKMDQAALVASSQ